MSQPVDPELGDGYTSVVSPAVEKVIRSQIDRIQQACRDLPPEYHGDGGVVYGLELAEGNLRWLIGERV